MTGHEIIVNLITKDLDADSGLVAKTDVESALRLPREVILALYKAACERDHNKVLNLAGQLVVRLEDLERLIT